MLLLVPAEIARFAALVAKNSLLRSTDNKLAFIAEATATAEAHCFRSNYGFDIREIYDVEIRLDRRLGGRLPTAPFLGWLEDAGSLTAFGDNTGSASIDLSDFTVDSTNKQALIRCLSSSVTNPDEGFNNGFRGGGSNYQSIYSAATSGYRLKGGFGEVYDNENPYRMRASFKSGLFAESVVDTSGAPGDSEIRVANATDFLRGREFYFDTDPVNEKSLDRRFITDVDFDNNIVFFRPALNSIVPVGSMFRMIDRAVRAAVGDIITDMLTYPANTKTFIKNLSKFDVQKQWVRTTNQPVPGTAADKLDPYRLI